MQNKRLVWADSLKGILIILVVLGHAIQRALGSECYDNHLWNMIYSFHMPGFMAVSGFLAFRPNSTEGLIRFKSVIYRRFLQLIVPFLMWSSLLLLVNGSLTKQAFFLVFLYPDGGLWFLWVLFFISTIFSSVGWLVQKLRLKDEVLVLGISLLLACLMVLFDIRVFGFQFIAYYFIFYSLGYYIHKYYDQVVTGNGLLIVCLVVVWGLLAWFWHMHDIPSFLKGLPIPATLMQYAYRFITAAIAVYLLFAVSPKLLDVTHKWNKPFVALGSISLGIYTVHFILIGKIVAIYNNLGMNNTEVIMLAFISALIVSWLIVWLLSKWNVTARWLLGRI